MGNIQPHLLAAQPVTVTDYSLHDVYGIAFLEVTIFLISDPGERKNSENPEVRS